MIVILDTAKGKAYNFRTRKEAGEFIGVSQPTLRAWLSEPFFLHKTLIITITSHEKVKKSNRALLKKAVEQFREIEIHNERMAAKAPFQGVQPNGGQFPINGSRSDQPAEMAPLPIKSGGPVFVQDNPGPTQ